MELFTVVFKKDELISFRFFFDEEIFPRFKFFQLYKLPVIQTCTSYGLFVDLKSIRFDENEFSIERDASAPDTPGITGYLRRKKNDFEFTILH